MKYLVSILLPSRKRFDALLKSVKSLYDKAENPELIELLLRFDEDDLDSIARIKEIDEITTNYQYIIGERYEGYFSLDKFVNELCEISQGDFFLLWNDDALMMNYNWDGVISLYESETVCLQMDNNHFPYIFPIISRDIYEALGYFSGFPCDTWIHDVCSPLGIEIIEDEIYAIHDRADVTGNNDDETYKESMNSGRFTHTIQTEGEDTASTYYSAEVQKLVKEDIIKLKKYLDSKK
jgi:hypothetical protein|tara:strand:+ start:727 stop:1437 length:711 start_codon:yes stop_codon:yes gene_type:complete